MPRSSEQSKHRFLPIDRGHGRGPKGEPLDSQLNFKRAILGDAGLRNVEVAEDLNPHDHRIVDEARQREDLSQPSIYPHPDPTLGDIHLEVNI